MNIKDLGLKAVIDNLWGTIGFTGEMKEISGVSKKTGKDYAFHTQFLVLNNVEGKIIDPITDNEIEISDDSCAVNLIVHSKAPITKDMKGQTLSLSHLTIREYEDGEETKRTLNAKMPDRVVEPSQTEKVAVSSNPTTPLPNEALTILKEIQTKVNSIWDFIDLKQKEADIVDSLEQLDNAKLGELKKASIKVPNKVEYENADIKYNENGLHIEAVYKEEVRIWDITLYDIPAKSSFPPLPLEISGFAQSKSGRLTIIGQIISRLEKDPKNQKLILLIREKCE